MESLTALLGAFSHYSVFNWMDDLRESGMANGVWGI